MFTLNLKRLVWSHCQMSDGKIDEREIQEVLRDCAKQFDLPSQLLFGIYEKERSALSQRRRSTIFGDLRRLVSESITGDQDKTKVD